MAIGRSVEYSIVKADKVISWRKRKEDGMEKQKRVKKLEEKGDQENSDNNEKVKNVEMEELLEQMNREENAKKRGR